MKKRMIFNIVLASFLLISVLSTGIHKAQAGNQDKQGCIDPYSCFWGKTYWEHPVGQHSHTESSNGSTFYYLSVNSRGWSWSGSAWYLNGITAKDRYWGTTTADAFVSAWAGGQQAITKHSAQKHPGGNVGYLFNSEKNGWDAANCWLDANNCD